MRWRALILVFVCLSPVAQLCAQEVFDPPEVKDPVRAAEAKQQATDILHGVTPMGRIEINEWKMSNPGKTDSDYFAQRAHEAAARRETSTAKANGARLLSTPLARGWAYAETGGERGKSTWADFSNVDNFDTTSFTLIRENPSQSDTYRMSLLDDAKQPKTNLIWIHGDPQLQGLDLGAFFQTNLHFLQDFPAFRPHRTPPQAVFKSMENVAIKPPSSSPTKSASGKRDEPRPHSSLSDAFAVTFARASRDATIVTVFDLRESVEAGGLRGYMFVTRDGTHEFADELQIKLRHYSHPDDDADIGSFLSHLYHFHTEPKAIRRIFLYGDSELISDVVQIPEVQHCELIRRTNAPLELSILSRRLDILSRQPIASTQLAVVNGIPDSEETLRSISRFLGPPEMWLAYRADVTSLLAATNRSELVTVDDLRKELIEGNNDVLLLFAHSDGGMTIYLGTEKLTVKDIQSFPDRQPSTRRPRLAILFSCDTGKGPQKVRSLMGLGRHSEVDRLAQTLLKKGYFDRVVAPDHSFGPVEGKTVLKRLLDNPAGIPNISRWANWAYNLIFGEKDKG